MITGAQVEYIVNTRTGDDVVSTKKSNKKSTAPTPRPRRKEAAGGQSAKVAAAVDVLVHSTEMTFRQNEKPVIDSRISRSRFQGQISPESPVFNVTFKEAPPRLQEILKAFDTTAATLLLDENSQVVSRRFRNDLPFHAIVETLLSIHTPIPRAVAFWEAPTQLAMGQRQTAKGILRFEKEKTSIDTTANGGTVKVKVSGRLKAEGVVVGNYVKDGIYSVTGEQIYEPSSREWRSARWSVAVENDLVNAAGLAVAHAKGKMLVASRLFNDTADTTNSTIATP